MASKATDTSEPSTNRALTLYLRFELRDLDAFDTALAANASPILPFLIAILLCYPLPI